jgi:thioester reductase-like protein
MDNQVKVRGFRIELGEIEAVISQQAGVSQAVVVVHEGPRGKELVAYFTQRETVRTDSLREALLRALPDYMVPQLWVPLEAMPLSPNGKIDRKALPKPVISAGQGRALSTPTESALAQIWQTLLGVEAIHADSNFFELGGTSLLVPRLFAEISARFGRVLPMATLFAAPVLSQLAASIDGAELRPSTFDSADLVLGDFQLRTQGRFSIAEVESVFLTGATGFVGAFLLSELLQKTRWTLRCLVRAASPAEGRTRLDRLMQQWMLPKIEEGRVEVICGDLALPLLGLATDAFARLSESVELIIHNGALVNFTRDYGALRPANVLGTRAILELASRGRTKALHFVSTVSVLGPKEAPDHRALGGAHLDSGYAQSKWVAEELCLQAAQLGLNVVVYRPDAVWGHSSTGASNLEDFMLRALLGSIAAGVLPLISGSVTGLPVDYVVSAIVGAMLKGPPSASIIPISNHSPLPIEPIIRALASAYGTRVTTAQEWKSLMQKVGTDNPAYALVPILSADAAAIPTPLADTPWLSPSPSFDAAHASVAYWQRQIEFAKRS